MIHTKAEETTVAFMFFSIVCAILFMQLIVIFSGRGVGGGETLNMEEAERQEGQVLVAESRNHSNLSF